jgi:magnesium transporter
MIVDCAAYADGRRRAGDLPLEQAGEIAGREEGFVWVGVFEPSEAEFKAIAAEFGLHELAVEDAVRAHQRPKLEAYGETIHVVVKPARYVDPKEVIDVGELSIFVASGFVITVRHGKGDLAPRRRPLHRSRPGLRRGRA